MINNKGVTTSFAWIIGIIILVIAFAIFLSFVLTKYSSVATTANTLETNVLGNPMSDIGKTIVKSKCDSWGKCNYGEWCMEEGTTDSIKSIIPAGLNEQLTTLSNVCDMIRGDLGISVSPGEVTCRSITGSPIQDVEIEITNAGKKDITDISFVGKRFIYDSQRWDKPVVDLYDETLPIINMSDRPNFVATPLKPKLSDTLTINCTGVIEAVTADDATVTLFKNNDILKIYLIANNGAYTSVSVIVKKE